MTREIVLDSDGFEEASSLDSFKIIEREKHYRHNAEHRTFVFRKDDAIWRGTVTAWEDTGLELPVKCSEVEEYTETVVRYRAKQ